MPLPTSAGLSLYTAIEGYFSGRSLCENFEDHLRVLVAFLRRVPRVSDGFIAHLAELIYVPVHKPRAL